MAFWGTFAVGALRKYAGGIFLASDLGSYAAVASAVFTQRDRAKAPRPRGDETPHAPIITKIPSCHTGKSVVHCPLSLHFSRDSDPLTIE